LNGGDYGYVTVGETRFPTKCYLLDAAEPQIRW
jgi:hypothetical protein